MPDFLMTWEWTNREKGERGKGIPQTKGELKGRRAHPRESPRGTATSSSEVALEFGEGSKGLESFKRPKRNRKKIQGKFLSKVNWGSRCWHTLRRYLLRATSSKTRRRVPRCAVIQGERKKGNKKT